MKRPDLLCAGQTIGIAAPAAKADQAFVLKACQIISSWGFKVAMAKHWNEANSHYLSAPDPQRLDDFQQMLDDPNIHAIFCARGGYGTTRILDSLTFDRFLQRPKWIVGFSDITAFHLKLHQVGVESIHGCMPVQFPKAEYAGSVDLLRKLIMEGANTVIEAAGHSHNREGAGAGHLIGGNLTMIADALGTPTSPDTAGKVLVLEEVGEPLYKIDRMLTQLKRAGKFTHLAGLVMGYFTDTGRENGLFDETLTQMVLNKVRDFQFPVGFGFPIGHQAPNLPWRHAAHATLTVTKEKACLRFV